jgi:integral membrane sensor domain MASE1
MLNSLVNRSRVSPLARVGLLGLAYFAGAELGHVLSLKNNEQAFATVWPPAGLLVAALVQNRLSLWPALLLAACGANLLSDVLHDISVRLSIGFCVANCIEACTGAWLLRWFAGTPFTLGRMRDLLGLACFSALIGPMVGAAIGAGMETALGTPAYWSAWQVWWVGHACGVLVFAPVVFTWTPTLLNEVQRARMIEGVALFLGVILVTEGVYGNLLPPPLGVPIFILPFLLWAAFRFGPSGTAAALMVVAVIGIWNVSRGRGPYTVPTADPRENLMRAQAALCVIVVSLLVLANTVADRTRAEQQKIKVIGELEQALSEIKTLQGLIPLCAWCKKIRDDQGFWRRLEDYLKAHTEAEFTHAVCPACLEKQLAALGKPPASER